MNDLVLNGFTADLARRVGVEPAFIDSLLERGGESYEPVTRILRDDIRQLEQLRLLSLSQSSIHIDGTLPNLAVSLANRDFIADGVLPVINVQNDTDKFWKWDADTWTEEQADARVGVEELPKRIRAKTTTDSYSTIDYALMDLLTQKELANADAGLMLETSIARIILNRLLIARERRVASVAFAAANFTGSTSTLAGTTQWSDFTNSDPVTNLIDAIEGPFLAPNVLVMGAQVWTKLQNHPKFLAMVTGRASTSSGAVPLRPNLQMVADAFGLDAVLVGRAKYNTNREGATSATSYIWGKHAALIRVERAPNIRETAAFGYTFRSLAPEVQRIEERLRGRAGGTWIKVGHSDAEKVVAGPAAGYLYVNAVA